MSMTTIATLDADGSTRPKGMGPMSHLVDRSGRFNRLRHSFQNQLKALANDFYKTYHEPLVLTDTVRTDAEQAQAHREKPFLALPAGHPNAMHPKGLAVDVDVGESKLLSPEMLVHNGLHRPALSKGETWHIEPVSSAARGAGSSSSSSPSLARLQPLSQRGSSARLSLQAAMAALRSPRFEGMGSMKHPGGLTGKGAPTDQRSLKETAVEVEAMFLEKMLGQMRSSMVDPLHPTPQKLKGYTSMADQQLARSLAAGGGIGLAGKIMKDLASLHPQPKRENRHEGDEPVPEKSGAPAGTQPV